MRDRGKGRGKGNIEGEKVGEMLLRRGTGEMMRGKGRMGGEGVDEMLGVEDGEILKFQWSPRGRRPPQGKLK